MKLLGKRLGGLGAFAMLLIAVLPVPCLAQERTQPSESTASTDREPQDDSEDRSAGDGTDGEPAIERSGSMEVIVVEGARAEGLREVPISVTHFGASDIENLRIQNVADLSAYTPNLEINTAFAASNPTLFIRGVGLKDYNSNSTGAVSIWQDGIQMNSPSAQLFSLFDIEGIEVLRGPVGGIGGRNASAGLIRMNSFKPNGEWTADGSFSYGNLDLLEFEGALGFPIFPESLGDTLSARVSFVSEFRDGYTDNVCADWDAAQHGLLASSEETTREFYDLLEPADRGSVLFPDRPNGNPHPDRYIYKNFEAVEHYNAVTSDTINLKRSLASDGVSTEFVGQQSITFRIPQDDVCGLTASGNLATQRNRGRSEHDWSARRFWRPLSDFQDLQDTYNDVEYYASRFLLRYQPTERWDLLGNFHWGENRGDSYHLQSVGVFPGRARSGEFIEEPQGFTEASDSWTELDAIRILNEVTPGSSEGEDGRRGLRESGSQTQFNIPGFTGDDPFSGFYDSDGDEKLDLRGTSLNASYELDSGRLLYVGGYEFNSRRIEDEGDASPGFELEAIIDDETWQVTQDLRLELEGDGYTLRLGGFFIHEELDSNNFFKSTVRFQIDQDYEQDTDAWNIGADLHYDFIEEGERPWLHQISLDSGVRYNWEQKKFGLGASTVEVNPLGVAIGRSESLAPQSERGIWREWTGEVTLSIKPLESLRLYGKYTHGFKAGHFNAGLTIEPDPDIDDPQAGDAGVVAQSLKPVDPEEINAVEVGLKSSWFDDRVELSGALFRYWYDDLQVFDIVNEEGNLPTQQLLNSDADVLGAELEATLRPIDGLLLQGGLGWLDTEFGEFVVEKRVETGGNPGQSAGGTAFFNYEGNPLIAAPEWSFSGYVEYELPLYRWGSLIPIFDCSYKSRTYLDAQKETLISQEPYWIYNARLVYRTPGGGIEVAGWVENFMDEEYKIDSFDLSRQFSTVLEVWSEPRTYGFTISYSF